MFGSNGLASILGATITLVGSTIAAVALFGSGAGRYALVIAVLSYLLLGVVLWSFVRKLVVRNRFLRSRRQDPR